FGPCRYYDTSSTAARSLASASGAACVRSAFDDPRCRPHDALLSPRRAGRVDRGHVEWLRSALLARGRGPTTAVAARGGELRDACGVDPDVPHATRSPRDALVEALRQQSRLVHVMTVAAFAERWLLSRMDLQPGAQRRYAMAVRTHVVRHLGTLPLEAVT